MCYICCDFIASFFPSLLSFAKDCDYVMDMVDNLLDVMTSGEHSKTVKVLEAVSPA